MMNNMNYMFILIFKNNNKRDNFLNKHFSILTLLPKSVVVFELSIKFDITLIINT